MKINTILFLFLFGFALFSSRAQADECGSYTGNLVANCGFETGTMAGWNLTGYQSAPKYLGVSYGVDTSDAHSGTFGAYFGGFGGALNLSEMVPTLPGTQYQITYWLAQSPVTVAPYQSSFLTSFNGLTLFSAGNAPDFPYRQYSFLSVAASTESLLNFGARDDNGFFSIDDVSVIPVATPEPGSLALVWTTLGFGLVQHRFRRRADKEESPDSTFALQLNRHWRETRISFAKSDVD